MSTILSWFSVEGSSPTPKHILHPTIAKVRERLPQGETTELSSPTGGPPLQKRVPWTSRVERDMRRYLEEANYPTGERTDGRVGVQFWNESSRDVIITPVDRSWSHKNLGAGSNWPAGFQYATTYTIETFDNPSHKAKTFATTTAGSQHVFIVDLERPAIVERFWEVRRAPAAPLPPPPPPMRRRRALPAAAQSGRGRRRPPPPSVCVLSDERVTVLRLRLRLWLWLSGGCG